MGEYEWVGDCEWVSMNGWVSGWVSMSEWVMYICISIEHTQILLLEHGEVFFLFESYLWHVFIEPPQL